MKELDKTKYDRAKICFESFKCKPKIETPDFNSRIIGISHYNMVPGHTPKEHAIIILHKSLEVKRIMGGSSKQEHIHPDQNVIINRAGVSHESLWNTRALFLLMFLCPKFIAYSWYEFIDPDLVEILPHFSQTDPTINRIALKLYERIRSGQLDSCYEQQASLSLGFHLFKTYGTKKIKPISVGNLSNLQSQQIVDYIRTNLGDYIDLDILSELVGMSKGHFGVVFKKTFGLTPCEYIRNMRLEEAERLLRYTKLPIHQISILVGIHPNNFSHLFKLKLGLRPSQHRNRLGASHFLFNRER